MTIVRVGLLAIAIVVGSVIGIAAGYTLAIAALPCPKPQPAPVSAACLTGSGCCEKPFCNV